MSERAKEIKRREERAAGGEGEGSEDRSEAVPRRLAAAAHRHQLHGLGNNLQNPRRAGLVGGEAVSGLREHLDVEVCQVCRLDQDLMQAHAEVLPQVSQELGCRDTVRRAPKQVQDVSGADGRKAEQVLAHTLAGGVVCSNCAGPS